MPTLLRQNPMFRLSMSSLELFHSNFLEWLFDLDHDAFLKCFDLTVSNPAACTIEREYHLGTTRVNGKNKQWVTDIAVFEKADDKNEKKKKAAKTDKNKKLILIIENKFKSTPSKGQLENQSTFTGTAKKVLLSLFKYSGALHKFDTVLYETLFGEIRKNYALHSQFVPYIQDYCDMLDRLQFILDNDPLVKNWRGGYYTAHLPSPNLETCGIMDAFRKYQAASLVNKFEESIVEKDTTRLPMTCEHSLNHKRACATIAYELNNGTLCVGVQVEQDQLRIFFENKDKEKSFNKDQIDQAQRYWKEWLGNPLGGSNKKQYCSYSNSFIYRYVKLESIITTDELCNRVEKLLGKISGKKDDIINKIYETIHQ